MKLSILQLSLFIFLFSISCSENQHQTIITGNIPNLPDGKLYLYEDNGTNKIDSVNTKDGKFKLTYNWVKDNEPVYLGLNHKDNKDVLRFIGFPTNSKYKGSALVQSRFLSDSIINISGKIFDNTPHGFPEKIRSVDLDTPIITGKQTEAFYNVDEDLFEKIDSSTIKVIKEKIDKYPYSYHLLYRINENRNSFSPQQIEKYLKSFKGEIKQSKTYKNLFSYNEKRLKEKNVFLPLLIDNFGLKKNIIDKRYKKHLIVFWASWCGPCRKEIPILKEIYKKYSSDVEFISISTDEDIKAWKKAMYDEQMKWKQLIVKPGSPEHEKLQMHLKLNQAIPYTVLIDNNLKVLSFSTGLSDIAELEKLINK